ncbi:MAG: hypothetical protein ACREA9_27945, partial [Pyrinomonadaceae bacterium]
GARNERAPGHGVVAEAQGGRVNIAGRLDNADSVRDARAMTRDALSARRRPLPDYRITHYRMTVPIDFNVRCHSSCE